MAHTLLQGSPRLGMMPDTAHNTKQHRAADKDRRPATAAARRQSLRRVKDSKEELRRTRARGASSATIESSNTTTTSGRSFTVGNINHGIIYLRPVVRPGNQRLQPDPFIFPPQTPPDSATLESKANRSSSNDWDNSLYGSRTPVRADPPPLPPHATTDDEPKHPSPALSPPRPAVHIRSRSFSTADNHTATSHSTEPGTFKVVIERPFGRPKTADTGSLPILQVPIPHYRLGTPRFSTRGTAMLRSSVHTRASGTEDARSSLLTPQRVTHSFISSRRRSDMYSPIPPNLRSTIDGLAHPPSTAPTSARVSKVPIGPQLYDALTINPDDRAVVRFSSSGDILAATPSRLVAHITSPSFLDYELLSDFFLTFRSFLSSRELVAYLVSRLRWAVNRQDDFGRIVRVRTFVALRHWILNYFVDDFVPMYQLRVYLCELVNGLYKDLGDREDGGGGDIKIVGELKKCWRRTCALYWDSEVGVGKDHADEDILPGGQADVLAIEIDEIPEHSLAPSTPPRQTGRNIRIGNAGSNSNPGDHFATRHMDWVQQSRHTPQNSLSSPYIPSQEYENVEVPLSPASELSMQVMSCSIPVRGFHKPAPSTDMPLYPHPVPHPVPARVAASPQQPVAGKRPNRPSHAHKRSGSFSDALRDHRAPLSIPKNAAPDVAISSMSSTPGSLVRGGIFGPSSPYIDLRNGGLRHTRSHLELEPIDVPGDLHTRLGHAPNPHMKKFIGSVRRALSSKQPSASTPHLLGSAHHVYNASPTRSSNPATLSAISGGVHKRRYARPRPQVRVDILAYNVGESFKDAVKEQLENEQQQSGLAPDLGEFQFEFEKQEATASNELLNSSTLQVYRNHSNVTSGSKSIVIVDDTGPAHPPLMSGALPALPYSHSHHHGQSIDERLAGDSPWATQETKLPSGADLESSLELRRSSRYSIPKSVINERRSLSELRERMHSFRRRGSTRASMARSGSLRKHASYNSGLSRQNTGLSLATSLQTMSSDNDPFFFDNKHPTSPLGPARQLRRRPGGDLRAVDNVHDLEYIQRPHSTGSISVRTHSVANSVILRSDRYDDPLKVAHGTTDDDVESNVPPKKKSIELVNTHSSQPNLRPSFEAEVAKLAALPDDTDDDGGIESALMKLEGRYEKKSPSQVTSDPEDGDFDRSVDLSTSSHTLSDQNSSHDAHQSREDGALHRPLAPSVSEGQSVYRLSSGNFQRRVQGVQSAVHSEGSYSSIPLLDRGLSDIGTSARTQTMESFASSAQPAPLKPKSPLGQIKGHATPKVTSSSSSIEHIIETESMKRIPRNGTLPRYSKPRESFLLDDNENLSDMTDDESEMLARSEGTSHGVRSFFDDEPATLENESDDLPTHPMRHPPTPPLTANPLKDPLSQLNTTVFDGGLPTPRLTPTSRINNQSFANISESLSKPLESAIELQDFKKDESPTPPAHLPFILAYDSETVAQQFTVVEKDALDEIDWKELIELRWKQSSPQIRDWVQYLRTQEARGVDVVIARFNLVVKWAVSECLLTEAIEERARCIVKYIHIAAHCRRLRNYATMYQITIALLSTDVSRLKNTWALIPAAEMQTMGELEALVQPLRNFHNLRVEMETATVEEGCIPFIGKFFQSLSSLQQLTSLQAYIQGI
jgi:hypothetical protein